MNFRKSTADYEKWISRELTILPEDLRRKHEAMREGLFPFLRATFYRWAQRWPEVCPECDNAPRVLAVGDLHVENFGTWRDVEGRLVWGLNDFDEVCRMPYTIDLVRLAASAHIAIDTEQLTIAHHEACDFITAGYRECLEKGGMPWVLAGRHVWLRDLVGPFLRDPMVFWKRLEDLEPYKGRIPGNARRGLDKMMPPGKTLHFRFAHRIAGLGSLGRQRFIAIAEYGGALVCREAKALAPSAWFWAHGEKSEPIRYQKALDSSVRAKDPFVRLQGRWIVRRLAPDCTKIDLSAIPRAKDEGRLLRAMGWETANLHLASGRGADVLKDLAKRPKHWLHDAAAAMVKATRADWEEWRAAAPKAKKAAKKSAH
jgi:hypothetical protein